MTNDNHGRVLTTHWFHYLMAARQARDRTAAALAEEPSAAPPDALVAILMSALAVEAFINQLAEAADFAANPPRSPHSPVLALLRDLAAVLGEIESDKGPIAAKYQMAARILSGHTFERGAQPFAHFRDLMSLRNLLVHLRPGDTVQEGGYIVPSA